MEGGGEKRAVSMKEGPGGGKSRKGGEKEGPGGGKGGRM